MRNENITGACSRAGPNTEVDRIFRTLDWAFTILFAIELMMNLMAFWFTAFFKSAWNCWDTLIVIVSFLALSWNEGKTIIAAS